MSAWAVEYKEKNYFNLGYSTEVNNWKSFAKLDLEGKYCLTIIDDKSPKVFKHTNNSYLGGLSGYLATQISLAGTTWVDKPGERSSPVNYQNNQKMMSRNEGSTGDCISRNHFIKILKSEGLNFTDDGKKMELEQFIQILQSANNKKT
ncbi:MAG: hypothetical protein IPJ13_27085 [Saprospiraceae bacterium]|nr:hypothetical protein [Saprospiraceae bacterium]